MDPRRSSSIVLLRNAANNSSTQTSSSTTTTSGAFEVLMAKRSSQLKAFSSLYVFPGGVSEKEDGPVESHTSSKKCSLRELFEETGVLLSQSKGSKYSALAVFMETTKKREWQERVHQDPATFDTLIKQENVVLPFSAMAYLVTFITPIMEPRRFRTDFFVTYVENAVHVQLDGTETVEFQWISPKDAIQANIKQTMKFLPPQYYVLSNIASFPDPITCITSIEQENEESGDPIPILPHPILMNDKELVLAYPGDCEHAEFPSQKKEDKHRIHVKIPMGNGFLLENTLNKRALTKNDWEKMKLLSLEKKL
jgi:8-oxo-dGTP pyrophosphatase MutT (NUDIX family)